MIDNKSPQEKLLTMLTEIYDQLEELEEVLEHSLTDLRGNLYQQQADRIGNNEALLTNLEDSIHGQSSVNTNIIDFPQNQNQKKTLKLDLGF
jgi:hypothetical protein